MKWQIVIVQPPGYIHSQCFREVAETVMYGLRKLGHVAEMGFNVLHPGARHIVFGAHLLGPNQSCLLPPNSIIYNLEQIGGAVLPDHYYDLTRHHRVWDYSAVNAAEWAKRGVTAKVVPIGYVPELRKVKCIAKPDIDVLFVGSMNARRSAVVETLRGLGLAVHTLFGEYGPRREMLMAHTKIGLNVHYYESKVFEIARVSYFMANGIAVVTEDGSDIPEDLRNGLAVAPYGGLVETCIDILKSPKRLTELAVKGEQCFSARREEDILTAALS